MNSDGVATFFDLEIMVKNIIQVALTLGGIAVFVMLIVGGFKYLTSGGDPKQTASANSTITMAIVGLLAAIGAWFILKLLADLTGIDLFTFSLTNN